MSWRDILFLSHFALAIVVGLRVIYARRSSSAALAWLAVLFAFPFLGVLAYLLIGEPKLGRARAKREAELHAFHSEFGSQFLPPKALVNTDLRFQQLAQLTEKEAGFFPVAGNKTAFFHDTDSILQAFVKDIDNAKHCCLLEFYIVEGSGRVEAVFEALIRARSRGVRCQLLADGLGSKNFWFSDWLGKLQEAGVEVTAALPVGVLKSLWVRSDLRNHRKILVVDYRIAYTGSYNLVDPRLFKQDAGVGEWVDAVIRCEGMIAQELAAVFYGDWAVENAHNLQNTLNQLKAYENEMPSVQQEKQGSSVLQVIPSQPGGDSYLVYETLINALHVAQKEVILCTPYFVPDEALLNALITTAKRGVKVILVIPKKVDSLLVRYASRAYYQPLLNAGIDIRVFSGGLLHTKAVLIDNLFALFGTVNMDMRSFYLNLEVSLAIYDPQTVENVRQLITSYFPACEAVELQIWQKRRRIQRFIERCVRLASPLL